MAFIIDTILETFQSISPQAPTFIHAYSRQAGHVLGQWPDANVRNSPSIGFTEKEYLETNL